MSSQKQKETNTVSTQTNSNSKQWGIQIEDSNEHYLSLSKRTHSHTHKHTQNILSNWKHQVNKEKKANTMAEQSILSIQGVAKLKKGTTRIIVVWWNTTEK